MQDSTARPLSQQLIDHESIKRAIERLRQAANALLAAPAGSSEQFALACRVRWECKLAVQAAGKHGYPIHRPARQELVLPARVDVAIGAVHQSLRILELAWHGYSETAIGEALAEVVRCADELIEIYRSKGLDVGATMAKVTGGDEDSSDG